MKKNIYGLIAAFIVITSGSIGIFEATSAHALQSDQSASAAQGIQISPALVQLNGDPGKTYAIPLQVTNVTANQLVYTTTIDDFKAKDESGTPSVIVDDTLPATVSVKTWIATVPKFELTTHATTSITAHVTIPINAEPGGHYGVIQFSGSEPSVDGTGVGLSASAGTLLLIRVSGDITEKAALASFTTADSKDKQHSLFEYGPITFVTRIRNEGDVHVAPTGNIELHNIFGKLVDTFKVNSDSSNVLPSSIRRYESTYDKHWMFGRYTADLTLGYGTQGEAITGQLSFWVIPYKLILISLVVLITLIFVLTRVIKAYNKHIINIANGTKRQSKKK